MSMQVLSCTPGKSSAGWTVDKHTTRNLASRKVFWGGQYPRTLRIQDVLSAVHQLVVSRYILYTSDVQRMLLLSLGTRP